MKIEAASTAPHYFNNCRQVVASNTSPSPFLRSRMIVFQLALSHRHQLVVDITLLKMMTRSSLRSIPPVVLSSIQRVVLSSRLSYNPQTVE